jgi:hypothetical protein
MGPPSSPNCLPSPCVTPPPHPPLLACGCRYIYTSHDLPDQVGWLMRDYVCMSSADMVNWQDEGVVFSFAADNVTWGQYAWAQQVTSGG